MWCLRIAVLVACMTAVLTVQVAQFGCRTSGTYEIQFVLTPNEETVHTVYGGSPGNALCQAVRGGDGLFRLNIPIELAGDNTQANCGVVNPTGTRDFTVSMTTQSLADGFKPSDRSYNLQCHFNGPIEVSVNSRTAIQLVPGVNVQVSNNLNVLDTVLSFDVISADNQLPVTEVSFMQNVYFRISMDVNYHESQSMRVTDCVATGYSAGVAAGQVAIIGADGCPDAGTGVISGGFSMSPDNPEVSLTAPFSMFTINGATSVVFTCQATLCVDASCQQSCLPAGRRKRAAENNEGESGQLVAIVRLGHVTSDDSGTLTLQTNEEMRECTNWPYLIAIAALAFVLIISLGFGMLMFTKRPRDCRVDTFKEKPLA